MAAYNMLATSMVLSFAGAAPAHRGIVPPVIPGGVLDMAIDGMFVNSRHLSNSRLLEACPVGSDFTIESTAYSDGAGCYTDVPGYLGTAYVQQEDIDRLEDGGLSDVWAMFAFPVSINSSTSLGSSMDSSSFTALDVYEQAQVVWIHWYVPSTTDSSDAPLSTIFCSGLQPNIGLGHPAEVTEWKCGTSVIDVDVDDFTSSDTDDLVTPSESEFSVECGCDASTGDRIGGGNRRRVQNVLCLSALAAAVIISAFL